MRHSRFLPTAFAALLYAAVSSPAALAVPKRDAPVTDAPVLDASMTAANLLSDCVSPAGSGEHADCLGTVGNIMHGVDVAANEAQDAHGKPSICIPAGLDRQTVADEFVYLMRLGNGAFEKEKAVLLVGGVLMTLYPCG